MWKHNNANPKKNRGFQFLSQSKLIQSSRIQLKIAEVLAIS